MNSINKTFYSSIKTILNTIQVLTDENSKIKIELAKCRSKLEILSQLNINKEENIISDTSNGVSDMNNYMLILNKYFLSEEKDKEFLIKKLFKLPSVSPSDILGDIKNKKILDCGAGRGTLTKELIERKGDIYAVDIDPKRFNLNIPFKKADFNDKIPFKKSYFDKVVSICKWEKGDLLKLGCDETKIEYISNSISDEFFIQKKAEEKINRRNIFDWCKKWKLISIIVIKMNGFVI
ncbi:hypothetical protein LCGC14_2899260 [marine sediment metagenome]|uniref:Methyltransferase type 11 domain-containing protein n=1 Tax=marine sediment metagenome TaxID=412755 RepID=A0A0F8YGT5_9ZZZZ